MYIKHFLINYFSIIIQFQNTLHWSNLPSCFSYCEDLKLSILILHLVRLFSYPLNILHGDQDFKGLQCKPTSILSYQDIVQSYPDNILVLPWPIVWHKSSATYQYRLTKTKYRLTKATSLTKTPIQLECYPHPSHRTSVHSVQLSHISKIHKNESVKVCHFSWVKAFVAGLNTHLSIAESIEICQGVVK